MNHTLLEAIGRIIPPDKEAAGEVRRRLDSLIKPLGSLGRLEEHLARIGGAAGTSDICLKKKAVVVFCADNGVVARGISQSGQEVTLIVAENMVTGDTCVCHMARVAGADVIPVDMGIAADKPIPGLLDCRVGRGSADFSTGPAMSRSQAEQAVLHGLRLAGELKGQGYKLLATGEMGIGNTTTSSAVASVLLGRPVEEMTGRGAGLSDEGLARKRQVIGQGIACNRPDPADPLDVLAKVGGFDLGGIAGLCLGAAVHRIPVVLDGFISAAGALLACRMAPGTEEYLLPSHASGEPAGEAVLKALGLAPLLYAGMRLGEGTGAVATFPLYDMALAVYHNMLRFADEGMEAYVPQ